jgi:Ca2+-binding RTX toxin-like protein
MTRRLKRGMEAALAAGAVLAVGASASPAATITADGAELTYRAAPGEVNGVIVNGYAGGRVRINETRSSITAWPSTCEHIDPEAVLCPVPGTLRVELADGNDSFGLDSNAHAHGLVVLGGDGDDELTGHSEARSKTFDGGAGNDLLKGFAGDDVLRGGPGNDILWGDEGNDELRGDAGDDQLKPDNGKAPGNDVVDGGDGFDLVDDWVQSTASGSAPPISISLDGAANDGRPGETDNVTGVEKATSLVSGRFVLSDGPDDWHIMANVDGGASTVLAGGGNDRIKGEDHNETIDGGPGDDVLEGGKRDDVITGGPGRDSILGDESDTGCTWAPEYCLVFGNDVIDARDGEQDSINCGPGTDKVLVDPIDVHAGCETVEGAGAGHGQTQTPTTQTTTTTTGTQTRRGRARLTLVPVRLGRALRSGFSVRVAGARPGRLSLTARRGRTIVATGSVRVPAGGRATVRMKVRPAARRLLRRTRSVQLRVSGTGVSATVTLRR